MMKPIMLATMTMLLISGNSGKVDAQMMGRDPDSPQIAARQNLTPSYPMHNYPHMMNPAMMGGYGYGMGPGGGMGHFFGMGRGMMGNYGYGAGPCAFGNCYGYGTAQGQPDQLSPEEYQKFLDETKELRKKLYDLQFEYGELVRNPETTMAEKNKMEKDMLELQQRLQEKMIR